MARKKADPRLFQVTLPGGKPKDTPVLWLHGWGQTHKSLLNLAGLFKRGFSNTLYDLPGFGESPQLAEDAGTEAYSDLLEETLDQDGKGPVILVGHSFGCRVSIRLAAKRPDLVQGMVLIAGAGLQRKRGPLFMIRRFGLKLLGKTAGLFDRLLKTQMKAAYRERFGSSDYRNAGTLRTTFIKTVTEDLTQVAKVVSCPVLLLYGENDTETPVEFGERYAALMPDAKLKVLDGFGHLDILTEGRYQCQNHIAKFLVELKA